ncbi:MAG: hypothetical protein AAFV51_03315 [Pseudomonadota bacterium]
MSWAAASEPVYGPTAPGGAEPALQYRQPASTTTVLTDFPRILADYRLRANATDYFIDRDGIEPVDDVTFSVGSVINVQLGPFFRAYAASTDELFPTDDFYYNLTAIDRNEQETVGDALQVAGFLRGADAVDRILSLGFRPAVFFGDSSRLNVYIPFVTYERREVRGSFVAERDTFNREMDLVAPAGEQFNIVDDQTIVSLQWGNDPRYSAFSQYRLRDEASDSFIDDISFFFAVDIIEYESDVFDNIDDTTAELGREEFSGYALRGGGRRQPREAGLFFTPGFEAAIYGGDRAGLRAGGYLGAFFNSGKTCNFGCVSFSMTLGGFYDESDFTEENSDQTPLGENRRMNEFETVFTRWSAEATASVSIRF